MSCAIEWFRGIGGTRYAYVRSCKVTELNTGDYLVQRVSSEGIPQQPDWRFSSLEWALERVADEPDSVVPRVSGVIYD